MRPQGFCKLQFCKTPVMSSRLGATGWGSQESSDWSTHSQGRNPWEQETPASETSNGCPGSEHKGSTPASSLSLHSGGFYTEQQILDVLPSSASDVHSFTQTLWQFLPCRGGLGCLPMAINPALVAQISQNSTNLTFWGSASYSLRQVKL